LIELNKQILKEAIILQVEEVLDISEPTHNPDKKKEMENNLVCSDSENRMLKLLLTNGSSIVVGFEYKKIPSFSKVFPGLKIF